MDSDNPYIRTLLLLHSFETFWAYYSLSSGNLYEEECRCVARSLIQSLEGLLKEDPALNDWMGKESSKHIDEYLQKLRALSQSLSPSIEDNKLFEGMSRFVFSFGVKMSLYRGAGWSSTPPIPMSWTSEENEYVERVIRWKGQMPYSLLHKNPDEILEQATSTETIVVVGDIRRSQDLMTYARNSAEFSKRMVDFIMTTRTICNEDTGFFDKFTGDGFILYFNEAICHVNGQNYKECFLNFIKSELKYCNQLFKDWTKTLRKHPSTEIGLSIGADLGQVNFHDLNNHLIAVGEPIVWATRMSSIGKANEVIINNVLKNFLENDTSLSFSERVGRTKAGEEFLAHTLEIMS